MQQVKIALAQGQVTILDSGVKPGQKIVVDGADRLRPDSQVTISQARQGGGGGQGAGQGSGRGSGQGADNAGGGSAGSRQGTAAGAGGKTAGKHQQKEQQ